MSGMPGYVVAGIFDKDTEEYKEPDVLIKMMK